VTQVGEGVRVSAAALSQLLVQAAERVDGVRVRLPLPRRRVELREGAVSLDVSARYGIVLPEAAREVQRSVADALSVMMGIDVKAVNVSIEELER
jgi:uncharacterized alkaline shock family protein YloU